MNRVWLALTISLALFVTLSIRAAAQSRRTEWWQGRFQQQGLVSWSGKILVGFTFDPEGAYPQRVAVVTIWPDLGNAAIAGEGAFESETKVRWKETSCMKGDCSQKVLGGEFVADISSTRSSLNGHATGPFGLTGEFKLQREKSLEGNQ